MQSEIIILYDKLYFGKLMPETVTVKLCDIPKYRISLIFKKLVWSRLPLTLFSIATVKMLNTQAHAIIGRQNTSIVYEIPDDHVCRQAYLEQVVITFSNGQEKPFGFATIDLKLMDCKKSAIVPVISYQRFMSKEIKLGDIEIKYEKKCSKTDPYIMQELISYLNSLSGQQVHHLYHNLRAENRL